MTYKLAIKKFESGSLDSRLIESCITESASSIVSVLNSRPARLVKTTYLYSGGTLAKEWR